MSFSFLTSAPMIQVWLLLGLLLALAGPIGRYVADVFDGERVFLSPLLSPLERAVYKLAGVRAAEEMSAAHYAKALFLFALAGFLTLFGILVSQPFPVISPDLAFNMAASFVTNTNWQAYAPETTVTATTQSAGLAVQHFLSASMGLAVMAALIRAFARAKAATIGNFWADLTRGVLYILLPLAFLLALFLLSQGVVQSFGEVLSYRALENETPQTVLTGPVASQTAIKVLGTNGGGYYAANAAHPLENPTPLSNFVQILAMLLLPAAATVAFGRMTGKKREGNLLLIAMLLLFVPLTLFCLTVEQSGHPLFASLGIEQLHGNMEGKETRFGSIGSALWTAAATASASGPTNAAIDSFLPLGGLAPLALIQFGEIVFGGAGTGLCGMLVFVLLTVFVAGLMIGRTPEYLGKKIGVFEIKMASLIILTPAILTLAGVALAVTTEAGRAGPTNPGAQGFTEILYAFASASNNNGSAMGGLSANTPFYNIALALCMIAGRFGVIGAFLALAGSLAGKAVLPPTVGTLKTDRPLFLFMLIGVIVLVGVLTYVPALALGPVAEHFHLETAS